MRFNALILASLTIVTGLTEARKIDSASIQKKLDQMDKLSFLKKARKLDDNDAQEEGYLLSATSSFRFNSCITIKSNEEDENQNYEGGNKKIEQYIVVDMVGSDGQSSYEYAVDISTFVGTMGKMVVEQVESYCSVCQEAADYCDNEDASQGKYQQRNQYYDAENNKTVEFIDCNTCALYNCNGENDQGRKLGEQNDQEVDIEDALEYLNELGECQQYSYSYENQQYSNEYNGEEQEAEEQESEALYIGYMCNEEGTGIDLGFFYDEGCSIYNDREEASQAIGDNSMAYKYLAASQKIVESVFLNQQSCSNLEFASPFDNQDGDDNVVSQWYQTAEAYMTQNGSNTNNYYDNGNQYLPQANEACTEIFEGEGSIALGTCNGDGDEGLCEALAEREQTQAYNNQNGDDGCSLSFMGSIFECDETDSQNYGSEQNQDYQDNGYDYGAWVDNRQENGNDMQNKANGKVGAMLELENEILLAASIIAALAIGIAAFCIWKRNKEASADKKEALIKGEDYAQMDGGEKGNIA